LAEVFALTAARDPIAQMRARRGAYIETDASSTRSRPRQHPYEAPERIFSGRTRSRARGAWGELEHPRLAAIGLIRGPHRARRRARAPD